MYKALLAVVLAFSILSAKAQTKGIIKGVLSDSLKNEPLELATVSVLAVKDSVTATLISYTVTDKKGNFALHNLPTGVRLKLLISFIGYKPYRKLFTLEKAGVLDLGNVQMSSKMLNEVLITGERTPIIVKKDTIEFAAEAFKVRPNAVVEELLKKLPGIEVDNQGFVMFNGKKVKKVLVDGKEFFANDIRIATKNLDAELIDKVQVYDDREDDPDHLKEEVNVDKIINLKLKKKLIKSVFGKVYASGGTGGKYDSGALFNLFKDTLQVSLLGQSNNLSNTGFDFNDLYSSGGTNRGGEAAFRGASNFGGRNTNGIQKNTSGGVNINTDYGKKLKVNLAYYYSRTVTNFDGMNNRSQLTNDTTFTTHTTTNRLNYNDRHNITASVRSQTNSVQWSYLPLFSFLDNRATSNGFTNSFSNFVPQINITVNTDNNTSSNLQFEHTFNFNKQLKKKGSSINIVHTLSISPNNNDDYNTSDLTSYISTFPSYSLNRYAYNRNKDISASLSFDYRFPIAKKLTADVNVGEDYNQVISKGYTYDFDPSTGLYDLYLAPLSNDLTRNLLKEHITPGITYNLTEKLRLVASITTQLQQANNQFGRGINDIDRKYFDVLPSVTLSYGNYSSGSYSVGYSQSVQLPNIGDMIPYSVVFSPLFTVTGNPDLKETRRHNFNAAYNIFNRNSQSSLSFYGNFGIEENGVFREKTLNADGAETTTPINKNGRYSSNVNVRYSKTFKKSTDLQLSSNTSFSAYQAHNFFEINHEEGYQNNYNLSLQQGFGLNWKDVVTIDPAININQTLSSYTGVQYNNINNLGGSFDSPFTVYWPKHMNFSGTYTYTYTPLVSPGYQKSSNLFNIAVSRQFLKKDRAEIKLSCYDILNQAVSSSRSVYENVITDSQSQIIRRYFLLTLRWKFNSSKTEEKKPMFGPLRIMR